MTNQPLVAFVVEDNPGDARLICEYLLEMFPGIPEPVQATTLTSSIEILTSTHVSVAILDLGLPDSQGVRNVQQLLRVRPFLPIVVLTGLMDDHVALEALKHGAQDYLIKGEITPTTLMRSIRYSIERASLQEELESHRLHLEELVVERTVELEKTLARLLESEQLANLGKLTSAVAHELRNPLSVLKNTTYLLRNSQAKADEKAATYYELFDEEIHRAESVLTSLLAYCGPVTPNAHITTIRTVIECALERQVVPPNISLKTPVLDDAASSYVDAVQIGDAFSRILQNSIDALGNEIGTITIEHATDPERAVIVLTDTGPGIPAPDLPQIYNPLFSTKSKSFGLGLPIARHIVQANGGEISVESTERSGTTVRIELPTSPMCTGNDIGHATETGNPQEPPAVESQIMDG